MSFPDSFATERLVAERLRADHVEIVNEMHRDPAHMELLGGVRTVEQTAQWMAFNLRHWDEFGFGSWLLRDVHTSDVIGRAILRHITLDGVVETEVGYSFLPPYWGRGLATEIATACVAYGRRELGLSTIVGLTQPHNTRSKHVLEKIGMVYERDFVHMDLPHVLYRSR